ncbi:MAG: TonB-dependent receptor [Candidatus Aminicenantales bacterium]
MVEGIIADTEGTPLPGVTVTIKGPGITLRSLMTDMNGLYRFPALPPGEYTITASLAGFKKSIQEQVSVTLEQTVTLNIKLEMGKIEEEVTVIGESPIVDMSSSKLTTNVKKEYFDSLPKGRSYQDMVYMAPSVQEDRWGIGVGGATGAENMFIIDGINTTDVEVGTIGTQVTYEFIEEVQTKTGGYEAEFGGALGGVVNVITKSGSNTFHGGALFNFESDKLYGEPKIGVFGAGAIDEFNYYDFGLHFGGPIIKDKMWIFLGATPGFRKTYYNPANEFTGESRIFEESRNTYYFSGKMTFEAAPGHIITASVFGDPRKMVGANPTTRRNFDDWEQYCVPNSTGGTYNFAIKYDGVFGNNWLLHILGGLYYDKTREIPKDLTVPAIIWEQGYLGAPSGYRSGGYGWYMDPERRMRWQVNADVTRFWGDHTIKVGAQFYRSTSLREDHYTSGFYRQIRPNSGYFRDRWRWTEGQAYTDIISLFLQDSWKVTDRLTLNIGVRMEDQNIHANDKPRFWEPNQSIIHWSFLEQIAPRVGFTYDVIGDGTSKLFGSYGRFFEQVPLDMSTRQFGAEYDNYYYYKLSLYDPFTSMWSDPEASPYYRALLIGNTANSFPDPDAANKGLKPQFVEEVIVGFEKQFLTDYALSVRGIWKRLGMVVEDGSFDGGSTYFTFNPGRHYVEGEINPLTGEPRKLYVDAFPAAKRNYYALEIMLNKRFSKNYQFTMSYTYAMLRGNFAGLAWHEYGQLDPNITANFDFPEFMYNAEGKLPNDMPHQLKLDGVYMFPGTGSLAFLKGLSLGMSFRYHTGTPLTKMGLNAYYSVSDDMPVCFLTERGSDGRLPSWYQLDIHMGYDLTIAGKYKVGLTFDIFNLLGTTIEERRYMVYLKNQYFGYPDQQDFWNIPLAAQTDNDYYGKGITYQEPFKARLGVKFSF